MHKKKGYVIVLVIAVVTIIAILSTGLIIKLTASGKLLNANVSQRKAESVSQAALEIGTKAVMENNAVFKDPLVYDVNNKRKETMQILIGDNETAEASLVFEALPNKNNIKYIKITSTGNYANEVYNLNQNIEIE